MKLLSRIFRFITILILIAIISAWLVDHGLSWDDVGRYVLDKSSTLASKVGQTIITMDWSFHK